jgi:hypothetical protein
MPIFLIATLLLLFCLGFTWHGGSSREIRFAKPAGGRWYRTLMTRFLRRRRVCLPCIEDLTRTEKASLSSSRRTCLASDFNISKRKLSP